MTVHAVCAYILTQTHMHIIRQSKDPDLVTVKQEVGKGHEIYKIYRISIIQGYIKYSNVKVQSLQENNKLMSHV
jgi:hypothetical protein